MVVYLSFETDLLQCFMVKCIFKLHFADKNTCSSDVFSLALVVGQISRIMWLGKLLNLGSCLIL